MFYFRGLLIQSDEISKQKYRNERTALDDLKLVLHYASCINGASNWIRKSETTKAKTILFLLDSLSLRYEIKRQKRGDKSDRLEELIRLLLRFSSKLLFEFFNQLFVLFQLEKQLLVNLALFCHSSVFFSKIFGQSIHLFNEKSRAYYVQQLVKDYDFLQIVDVISRFLLAFIATSKTKYATARSSCR